MKIKKLFISLGLTLAVGLGAGAGLLAGNNVKEARAAVPSSVYFKWTGSDWESWGADITDMFAYFFDGTTAKGNEWHGDTASSTTIKDGDTYCVFNVPTGATGVVFNFVHSGWSETEWTHQTHDLEIPTDGKDCFTLGSQDNYKYRGTWSTFATVKRTITKTAVEFTAGGVATGETWSAGTDKVDDGTTYNVPGAQYVAGHVFDGWYTDAACSEAYTAQAITADKTIYGKYTIHDAWSGVVYVDLAESGWAEADANYAVYFMNKTTYVSEVGGWSSYITGTEAGHHKVTVDYSLSFEPQQMLVARYDSEYLEATWSTDPWCSGEGHTDSKWGQTYDIDQISAYVTIGEYESGEGKNKNTWKVGCATVNSSSASWGVLENLSNVKENGENYVEYYNYVTLANNDEFKVVYNGTWYGNYTCHKSLKDNFGTDGDNITCTEGGLYSFYFSTNTHNVYITTPTLAAADEWGAYFLSVVVCDASGVEEPTGWSDAAAAYAALSDAVKDIIYAATADESGTYYEHAVKRYDTAVKNHPSLTRFITDHEGHQRSVEHGGHSIFGIDGIVSGNNITLIAIVSIIAVASISAVIIFVVVKRRKHN